jgi:hypothetical protein
MFKADYNLKSLAYLRGHRQWQPDMTLWISCTKFTVSVDVFEYKIVRTTPIVRKFLHQPVWNLFRWAEKFGDLQVKTQWVSSYFNNGEAIFNFKSEGVRKSSYLDPKRFPE